MISVFCRKNSKMVNPPILEATFASGIILIATGFYGTQFLINHSGSDMAKLAIETNLECLSVINSSDYANCTYKLERIIKNLTESGEIRPEDCELDDSDETIAYCPVWVWYYPQWLPMTDVTIVGVVGTNTDTETISPSPKLEKIFSRLSEASLKLTDLSDEGRMERLNKLGQIFSSQSGAPKLISGSSDRGKTEYDDELDKIFSAMLVASQDLADELDSADDDNNIENTLEALIEHLNLDNVESLMGNPELLQTLLSNFNANDFENPLSKFAPLRLLLPVLLSSIGGGDDTISNSGLMSSVLQGLETEDVADLLEKSGLIEIFVQHLETHIVNEASDKSDIERALAQNLKGNPYFENTLKSGITDMITQNLQTQDNKGLLENLSLLKLLEPGLQTDGLSLDKLDLIKEFLQNADTEELLDLIEKSGLVGQLPQLDAEYIEALHDKSDLGQALVDNIKANPYIDDSARSNLIKKFVPNTASLIPKMDTKDIQNPLDSLGLLKSLVPSLKTNKVPNTFNSKMDIMNSFLQNLKKEDVEEFFDKSGLIEALAQPLEKELQGNPDSESLTRNDKNAESSLDADRNKSPNSGYSTGDGDAKDTQSPFSGVDILKLLTPGLELDSTILENPLNKLGLIKSVLQNEDVAGFLASNTQGDLSAKLGFMQALLKSMQINNVESSSLNNDPLNKFSNQDENHAPMGTLDLGRMGENIKQSDQETSSSGESGFNFQKYKEQNERFSTDLGNTKPN